MKSKVQQANKLKRIKDIRFSVAEIEVARARSELASAENAVNEAQLKLKAVTENAQKRQREQLEVIFSARTDHDLHHENALEIYMATLREMVAANSQLKQAETRVAEAKNRIKKAQDELARRLRDQNKAKELVKRGAEQLSLAVIRQT